jgi:hypothetical protein
MSVFKFTGPDGKVFEIQGPPTATFEQAKAIFDKQLASGGLTGIPVGGIVNAVTQAAGGLSSALSQIGPQAAELTKQLSGAINLPTKIGALIPNAISVSDFVNTKISSQAIGSIASNQIQGLVAQASASVNQAATAITNVKGLGKFGLDASQLQLSGLIKPGIADQIKQFPDKFKEILSSPTSWTGKLGATNLDSVLNNTGLQTRIQQGLMNANFDQLKQLGTIKGTEVAAQLGPLLNNATKFGATAATAWLNGKVPGDLVNQMNSFATSAQFSQAFADVNSSIAGGGNPLQAGVVAAKGFANTTNRTNVDQATKAIIGDPKVASPDFAPPPTSSATAATAATSSAAAAAAADTVYTGTLYTPVITPSQLAGKNKQTLDSLYQDMTDTIRLNEKQIKSAEERQAFLNSIGDAEGAARAASRIPEYRAEIAQARANQEAIVNALNQLGPNAY